MSGKFEVVLMSAGFNSFDITKISSKIINYIIKMNF